MKKLLLAIVVVSGLFIFASSAKALIFNPLLFGTDDVNQGVICKIKDVTVLAQNAQDCKKIGGQPTHEVAMKKKKL